MLKPYTLRLPTATATATQSDRVCVCFVTVCRTVLCGALYAACVGASGMVFWDCSGVRHWSHILNLAICSISTVTVPTLYPPSLLLQLSSLGQGIQMSEL